MKITFIDNNFISLHRLQKVETKLKIKKLEKYMNCNKCPNYYLKLLDFLNLNQDFCCFYGVCNKLASYERLWKLKSSISYKYTF